MPADHHFSGSGDIHLKGSASVKVKYKYSSAGNIYISCTPHLHPFVKVLYRIKLDFSCNVDGLINIETNFSWNQENGPLYWYRVEGQCIVPNCTNSPVDFSSNACSTGSPLLNQSTSMMMATILASTPNQVCQQLQNMYWNWPISKFQVYSRPAINSLVNPITDACNTLQNVPFSSLSNCRYLAIQTDASVLAGMTARAIQIMFAATGGGNIFLTGRTGCETISYTPMSHYTYLGGGDIYLTNGKKNPIFVYQPNGITPRLCPGPFENIWITGGAVYPLRYFGSGEIIITEES